MRCDFGGKLYKIITGASRFSRTNLSFIDFDCVAFVGIEVPFDGLQ